MRQILKYTTAEDRSGVWEGTFEQTNDISVGDFILTHHTCKFCKVPILQKVIRKETALYFNGTPVHDLIVEGGSSYKSDLKLISKYDSRIAECSFK